MKTEANLYFLESIESTESTESIEPTESVELLESIDTKAPSEAFTLTFCFRMSCHARAF